MVIFLKKNTKKFAFSVRKPIEVAERIGRKRSWVDTKYSRLNARFNKAVKDWWSKNAK